MAVIDFFEVWELMPRAPRAPRAARVGLYLSTRDHRSVGYRVPKEWATMTEVQRGAGSLGAFKRGSRGGFLSGYAGFRCAGGCGICP